jgi:hypothetical protein
MDYSIQPLCLQTAAIQRTKLVCISFRGIHGTCKGMIRALADYCGGGNAEARHGGVSDVHTADLPKRLPKVAALPSYHAFRHQPTRF